MRTAYLLSLNKDADINKQWDFGLLYAFLIGRLWKPISFTGFEIKSCSSLPKMAESAIVVIPARHHKGLEAEVNKELNKIDKVVLFLMGDEEADFNVDLIEHNDINIWVQNPHRPKHDNYNRLGTGFPKHLFDAELSYEAKSVDMFFSGQVTHQRRAELIQAMHDLRYNEDLNIEINQTDGFTKGFEPNKYYKKMIESKIAPCPSGAVIPDSFRLFEALELMCLVIADQKTPSGEVIQYWDWLFNEITPLIYTDNWNNLPIYTEELLSDYNNRIVKQTVWWLNYKRDLSYRIMSQL